MNGYCKIIVLFGFCIIGIQASVDLDQANASAAKEALEAIKKLQQEALSYQKKLQSEKQGTENDEELEKMKGVLQEIDKQVSMYQDTIENLTPLGK